MAHSSRVLVILTVLGVMLAVGFGRLVLSLSNGVVVTEQPVHTASENPPAALSLLSEQQARRSLVVDEALADDLRQENANLRRQLAVCVTQTPTVGALAVLLHKSEADLQCALDRSLLIPDAAALQVCLRSTDANRVWEALSAERALYVRLSDLRATKPIGVNAMAWHQTAYVPFLEQGINDLVHRLYSLNLPSAVVEPLRQRLAEGI